MNAVQAMLPGMIAREDGRIIAIGGTFGYRGVANHALYAASKWALRGLMKSLAKISWNVSSHGGNAQGHRLTAHAIADTQDANRVAGDTIANDVRIFRYHRTSARYRNRPATIWEMLRTVTGVNQGSR